MFGSYFTLYELCGNQVRLYLRMLRVYLRTSDLLVSAIKMGVRARVVFPVCGLEFFQWPFYEV